MPKKPSKFWMFFQKIDRNTAECRLCGKHLRTCGNTTNLGKHIKRHPNYRELANQSGDSDEEKGPIKFENEAIEYSEMIYEDDKSENMYVQDPLLENNDTSIERKFNFVEHKKAAEGETVSLQVETRTLQSEEPVKRIKLESPTTSPSTSNLQTINLEAAHLAFAELFFACNIPFKVLNSIHLKRFISKLNKLYRPPSLRELTTTYLDRAYDKYKVSTPAVEQNSILLLSGWKDFTNSAKCIVACLYLTGENESRVYLNTWDLNTNFLGATDDANKAIIEESTKLAKEMYNAKIYAIISDNPYLNTNTTGQFYWNSICHSFLASCLAQDIVDQSDAKLVKLILLEFQNEQHEVFLVERGGSRIILPWEGRWCTYRDSFKCFVKNMPIFRDLVTEERCTIDVNLKHAIFSDELVAKVENYIHVLEPLCKLIYAAQKKKSVLAEVAEEWLQLDFPPEFQTHLQNKRNAALTPFTLAANFMHPIYRGKNINDNQMEALEFFFLENLDSKGLDDMFLFKQNEGIFQILAEKQVTTCNTYWSMASRKHPELTSLAKQLLCIPASVSYIDKIFAEWSMTHLSARNLLGMEVYRKLTKTHFALNLTDTS